MCGPADYDALRTSISRLLGLSAVTLAIYAIRRTTRLFAELRRECPRWFGARLKPGSSGTRA
jgi:hypothetical protein